MTSLKNKLSEAFGLPSYDNVDEQGRARTEQGGLKLRSAQEMKGGPVFSGIAAAGDAIGNMSLRAGLNYTSMLTNNPAYANSAEEVIGMFDNYRDEMVEQQWLNREGKWIQQEIEDIAQETKAMQQSYSVRVDENDNPLDPSDPVPEGMKVTEKRVYHDPRAGRPFSPLDRSTWVAPENAQFLVNAAGHNYDSKMLELLQQVNQAAFTWYGSSPRVGRLIGQLNGQHIQGLMEQFQSGQDQTIEQLGGQRDMRMEDEKHAADLDRAGAQTRQANVATDVSERTLRKGEEEDARAQSRAATEFGGGEAPSPIRGQAPPPGAAGQPATAGPTPEQKVEQAATGIRTSAPATPGMAESSAALVESTKLPSPENREEMKVRAERAAEYANNPNQPTHIQEGARKAIADFKRVERMEENIVAEAELIQNRLYGAVYGGPENMIAGMVADAARGGMETGQPGSGVDPGPIGAIQELASRLAIKKVRRDVIDRQLARDNPAYAGLEGIKRENALNEWLDEQGVDNPDFAGLKLDGGSWEKTYDRFATKFRGILDRDYEEKFETASDAALSAINTDPRFGENVVKFGGKDMPYDIPIATLKRMPVYIDNPDYAKLTEEERRGQSPYWFNEDFFDQFKDELNSYAPGTVESKNAYLWVIRQAHRASQAQVQSLQEQIDSYAGVPTGSEEFGKGSLGADLNTMANTIEILASPTRIEQAVSSKARALMSGGNPEEVQVAGELIQQVKLAGRRGGSDQGKARLVFEALRDNPIGVEILRTVYRSATGKDLDMPIGKLEDLFVSHGFDTSNIENQRQVTRAQINKLEYQKNWINSKRSEIANQWTKNDELTDIPGMEG